MRAYTIRTFDKYNLYYKYTYKYTFIIQFEHSHDT